MKRLILMLLPAIIAVSAVGHFTSRADTGRAVLTNVSGAENSAQSLDKIRSIQMAANNTVMPKAAGAPQQDEFYDLLIEGIDRRPHQKTGRSDVMMIIHCEPNHISFFSIPRDSLVQVRDKKDKLNHAFAYGGARLSIFTIEHFLKFKVDNYIVMDFETFLTTIDTIKTLTDNGRLIGAENFLMSGDNLLKWLRWRHLPGGDRRRAQRDQLFIKRVFGFTQDIYKKQPQVFEQCMKMGLKLAYETDLTYDHVAQLFETYKNFDLENNLERYVLPGTAQARARDGTEVELEDCEARDQIPAVMSDPNLTPEEKKQKRNALLATCPHQEMINFYIPKYDWSLETYIRYYRSKNLKMNYVEADTLRK